MNVTETDDVLPYTTWVSVAVVDWFSVVCLAGLVAWDLKVEKFTVTASANALVGVAFLGGWIVFVAEEKSPAFIHLWHTWAAASASIVAANGLLWPQVHTQKHMNEALLDDEEYKRHSQSTQWGIWVCWVVFCACWFSVFGPFVTDSQWKKSPRGTDHVEFGPAVTGTVVATWALLALVHACLSVCSGAPMDSKKSCKESAWTTGVAVGSVAVCGGLATLSMFLGDVEMPPAVWYLLQSQAWLLGLSVVVQRGFLLHARVQLRRERAARRMAASEALRVYIPPGRLDEPPEVDHFETTEGVELAPVRLPTKSSFLQSQFGDARFHGRQKTHKRGRGGVLAEEGEWYATPMMCLSSLGIAAAAPWLYVPLFYVDVWHDWRSLGDLLEAIPGLDSAHKRGQLDEDQRQTLAWLHALCPLVAKMAATSPAFGDHWTLRDLRNSSRTSSLFSKGPKAADWTSIRKHVVDAPASLLKTLRFLIMPDSGSAENLASLGLPCASLPDGGVWWMTTGGANGRTLRPSTAPLPGHPAVPLAQFLAAQGRYFLGAASCGHRPNMSASSNASPWLDLVQTQELQWYVNLRVASALSGSGWDPMTNGLLEDALDKSPLDTVVRLVKVLAQLWRGLPRDADKHRWLEKSLATGAFVQVEATPEATRRASKRASVAFDAVFSTPRVKPSLNLQRSANAVEVPEWLGKTYSDPVRLSQDRRDDPAPHLAHLWQDADELWRSWNISPPEFLREILPATLLLPTLTHAMIDLGPDPEFTVSWFGVVRWWLRNDTAQHSNHAAAMPTPMVKGQPRAAGRVTEFAVALARETITSKKKGAVTPTGSRSRATSRAAKLSVQTSPHNSINAFLAKLVILLVRTARLTAGHEELFHVVVATACSWNPDAYTFARSLTTARGSEFDAFNKCPPLAKLMNRVQFVLDVSADDQPGPGDDEALYRALVKDNNKSMHVLRTTLEILHSGRGSPVDTLHTILGRIVPTLRQQQAVLVRLATALQLLVPFLPVDILQDARAAKAKGADEHGAFFVRDWMFLWCTSGKNEWPLSTRKTWVTSTLATVSVLLVGVAQEINGGVGVRQSIQCVLNSAEAQAAIQAALLKWRMLVASVVQERRAYMVENREAEADVYVYDADAHVSFRASNVLPTREFPVLYDGTAEYAWAGHETDETLDHMSPLESAEQGPGADEFFFDTID